MGSTAYNGFRYPDPSNTGDVPFYMQQLAEDVESDMGVFGAWTPAWTGSVSNPVIGNGTLVGRYLRVGHLMVYSVQMVAGTTTTFGSGSFIFSFPVPITFSLAWIGSGQAKATTAGSTIMIVPNVGADLRANAPTSLTTQALAAMGSSGLAGTAWGTGALIQLSGAAYLT